MIVIEDHRRDRRGDVDRILRRMGHLQSIIPYSKPEYPSLDLGCNAQLVQTRRHPEPDYELHEHA